MLRIPIPPEARKFKLPGGSPARIDKIKKIMGLLFRHERIEGYAHHVAETRQYAERLIQQAVKHGDRHSQTMQNADYWLNEKDLVHKLFKVFVPRYEKSQGPYTQLHMFTPELPGPERKVCVLEMKGHPYPSLLPAQRNFSKSLSNVLLEVARKEYYKKKAQTILEQTKTTTKETA